MKNIKVLIVEDDPMMAFLHKELIKKKKIAIDPMSFKNGKEALNFLLSEPPKKFKYMILLDLNMPVMNGWTFLEELKRSEFAGQSKVVIVTSSIDRADREKAEKFETVAFFVTKPLLDLSQIEAAIILLKQAGEKVDKSAFNAKN